MLCVALFLKFAATFFRFLFVFLVFCLVNLYAVNGCCACVAVQLNSDQCSFFFLFLGGCLRFSLSDSLSIKSVFLRSFSCFFTGDFYPFFSSIFSVFCGQEWGCFEGLFRGLFWLVFAPPLRNLGSGIQNMALPPHFLSFLTILGIGQLRELHVFGMFGLLPLKRSPVLR